MLMLEASQHSMLVEGLTTFLNVFLMFAARDLVRAVIIIIDYYRRGGVPVPRDRFVRTKEGIKLAPPPY